MFHFYSLVSAGNEPKHCVSADELQQGWDDFRDTIKAKEATAGETQQWPLPSCERFYDDGCRLRVSTSRIPFKTATLPKQQRRAANSD